MTTTFGCVANTIRLRSGLYFDFADPQPDQFKFSDIAAALSKICRFGAQISRFYSVAEHLVHCCRVAQGDHKTWRAQAAVLMHDATEAFCGDVVKPLKIMLPEYSVIEKRVEAVIADKFGIDFDANRDYIREIDMAALIAERDVLFGRDDRVWPGESHVRKVSLRVECMTSDEAEYKFTMHALCAGINTSK